MNQSILYSIAYRLVLDGTHAGLTFAEQHQEDCFGNLILYSIENGVVQLNEFSIKEVNMDAEEFETRLYECIKHSLDKGYYDPQLIIYKSERIEMLYGKQEGFKRKRFKRGFKRA